VHDSDRQRVEDDAALTPVLVDLYRAKTVHTCCGLGFLGSG
jgi:hypothetical protein